jgi:hypothetical protein
LERILFFLNKYHLLENDGVGRHQTRGVHPRLGAEPETPLSQFNSTIYFTSAHFSSDHICIRQKNYNILLKKGSNFHFCNLKNNVTLQNNNNIIGRKFDVMKFIKICQILHCRIKRRFINIVLPHTQLIFLDMI